MGVPIRQPVAYLLRGNEPPDVRAEIEALESLGQPVIVITLDPASFRIPVALDFITAFLRHPAAVTAVITSLLLTIARANSRAALLRLPLALHLASTLVRRGIHHVHSLSDLASTVGWIMSSTADLSSSFLFDPNATLLAAKLETAAFVRSRSGDVTVGHAMLETLPPGAASAARLAAVFDEITIAHGEALAVLEIVGETLDAERVGIRWAATRYDAAVAEVSLYNRGERRDVVVKQHRRVPPFAESASSRAQNEFATLQSLHASMPPTMTVPRVLMFDEKNLSLVMEKAIGNPLDHSFEPSSGSRKRLIRGIEQAAEWLHAMQDVTRRQSGASSLVDDTVSAATGDLIRVAAADRIVRRHAPLLKQHLRALGTHVAARSTAVVGHHGDYWPGNIFISHDTVTVIDFEGYRDGLPAEDVAYFLLRTELLARRYALAARPIQEAFSEVWGSISREELHFFTLSKTLRTYVNTLAGNQRTLQRLWTMNVLRRVLLRMLDRTGTSSWSLSC